MKDRREDNLTEADMTPSEIRKASITYWKVKKIADKWHEERYDTDWDFLQGSLMKIYKLVNKK
jgi:hypothetical protein